MSFTLPTPTKIDRLEIDVDHMHECLSRWTELATRAQSISQHVHHAKYNPAVRGTTRYVLMADDSVTLAYIGPRGGFRVLHNFGKVV